MPNDNRQLERELQEMAGTAFHKYLLEELAKTDVAIRRASGNELAWLQGRAQELERIVGMIQNSRERCVKAQAAEAGAFIRKQMF